MRYNYLLEIYSKLDGIYLTVYLGLLFVGIWNLYADLARPGKLKKALKVMAFFITGSLYIGLFIFVCTPT